MNTDFINQFQEKVDELLIRHRSILDSLSKYQESNAKASRAVTKSVTFCGCLNIKASRPNIPGEATLKDYKNFVDCHFEGELCDTCRDIIEEKIGTNLFYLAAVCNLLDLSMEKIIIKEYDKISTLGRYNLT